MGAKQECDDDLREQRANFIVDKQYALYAWNNGKLQALAMMNGLLVTAAAFLFKDGPRSDFASMSLFAAIALLFVSIAVCLWPLAIFPQSRRSVAPWPNLRSSDGIRRYAKWEDYHREFMNADRERYLTDSMRQVFGMVVNNRRTHKLLEIAVAFTMLGVVVMFTATAAQFNGVWNASTSRDLRPPIASALNTKPIKSPQILTVELTVQEQLRAAPPPLEQSLSSTSTNRHDADRE